MSKTCEVRRLLLVRCWSSLEVAVATNDWEAVKSSRTASRSVRNELTWERGINLSEDDLAKDDSNSKTRSSQAINAPSGLKNFALRHADRSQKKVHPGPRKGVWEANGSGTKDWWLIITGIKEDWRTTEETKQTGSNAEAMEAKEETSVNTGAKTRNSRCRNVGGHNSRNVRSHR